MTLHDSFSALAQAFGWAVVHSTWQITLIWLVFTGAGYVSGQKNRLRYHLALMAMLASVVWFVATFLHQLEGFTSAVAGSAQAATTGVVAEMETIRSMSGTAPTPTLFESTMAWLDSNAILVGRVWVAGVVLLWLRLLGGWLLARQLRRKDVTPALVTWQEHCNTLTKKLKINTLVQLLESPHVNEPLTLGFWKPVVLFPAGMLLSLTPAQVEALLLHELAHIRRYDYGINLVQLALETCFFYHPLFWLISRDARVRREYCCDDVVLCHTSDPILYAKTLTDLQLSVLQPSTQFAMNATGKNNFTERILRIAGIKPTRESRPNWLIIMLLPTMLALCTWWPTPAAALVADTPEPTSSSSMPVDSVAPTKPAQVAPAPKTKATTPAPASGGNGETSGTINPSVAIQASKMNVFYIGVDNPVRIAAAGVPANEIAVTMEGNGTITGSNGEYIVRVTAPGATTVRVSRIVDGKSVTVAEYQYRIKRVPDPTPRLGWNLSGTITKKALLDAKEVTVMLDNFDFDAVCNVVGYELTILGKDQDPITFNVKGGLIPENARALIEKLAGDGDAIFFDEIKIMCPGDAAPRHVGGLAFKLKPEGQ